MKYVKTIKTKLLNSIKSAEKIIWKFSNNPGKDFSRNRKLPAEKLISSIISMGGASLTNELLDIYHCDADTPTASAFCQQRSKLNHAAFEYVFNMFTHDASENTTYNGYRLLATDGSDIHFPTDKNDTDSYYPGTNGQKPYNLLHLNAMYDLCEHIYVDAVIQKSRIANEHKAFTTMVDRYNNNTPTIFICDRGYEAYNNMAHIQEKGQFFLIRIKDRTSNSGIAKNFNLPKEDEFDISISLSLTRKQTNEMKELYKDRNRYRFIPSNSNFDFLPTKSRRNVDIKPYILNFRIVRVKINDGVYEMLVTNLNNSEFPLSELKKLYNMRWGIETSFRDLKYTIGLLSFHARKVEYVIQEIFSRLTMYNFSQFVTNHAIIKEKTRKYDYKVNFSVAVHVCKQYILNNITPSKLKELLARHIIPIRPDRKKPRKITGKTAISFTYRIS